MNKCVSKVRTVMNAPFRLANAALLSVMSAIMMLCPTLCAKINANLNMDTLFGSIVNVVIKIAFWCGALIAVGGVFSLVMAYKDDNGATRSAVKSCSVC